MDRAGRLAPSSPGRVAMAAAVALLAGCTMCPDPFDYSGPVPNGSAPQNDFRARSNGILPLGAAPKPWPPIVKKGATSGPRDRSTSDTVAVTWQREPTLADSENAVAAVIGEADDVAEKPVSVLVASAGGEDPASPQPSADVGAAGPVASDREPSATGTPDADIEHAERAEAAAEPVVAASAVEPDAVEADVVAAPAEPVTVVAPPLAETPGWRPKTR